MQWLAPPMGKHARCQKFSDAAIQFCLTIKCLFGQPLRQTLGLVQSLLRMAGLTWPVPDYSTVCRRQNSLNVQVHYRASEKGLHLLADSTGIKFLGEGEWKSKKHRPVDLWTTRIAELPTSPTGLHSMDSRCQIPHETTRNRR